MTIDTAPRSNTAIEIDWFNQLKGLTLKGVRPQHRDGAAVPHIKLQFTDGTVFEVEVLEGAFFRGCMINTLRKAQPLTEVSIKRSGGKTHIELRCRTFPLLALEAVNKRIDATEFPFVLTKKEQADA